MCVRACVRAGLCILEERGKGEGAPEHLVQGGGPLRGEAALSFQLLRHVLQLGQQLHLLAGGVQDGVLRPQDLGFRAAPPATAHGGHPGGVRARMPAGIPRRPRGRNRPKRPAPSLHVAAPHPPSDPTTLTRVLCATGLAQGAQRFLGGRAGASWSGGFPDRT